MSKIFSIFLSITIATLVVWADEPDFESEADLILWLNPESPVSRNLTERDVNDPEVIKHAEKAVYRFNQWSPDAEVDLVRIVNATGDDHTRGVHEKIELTIRNRRTGQQQCIIAVVFALVKNRKLDYTFEQCKYVFEIQKEKLDQRRTG